MGVGPWDKSFSRTTLSPIRYIVLLQRHEDFDFHIMFVQEFQSVYEICLFERESYTYVTRLGEIMNKFFVYITLRGI